LLRTPSVDHHTRDGHAADNIKYANVVTIRENVPAFQTLGLKSQVTSHARGLKKVLLNFMGKVNAPHLIIIKIIIIIKKNNNNNNNIQDNVYGAVIMAEPLREFTRFI